MLGAFSALLSARVWFCLGCFFCIDSVGNVGEDPLALVSRESMDVFFTLHVTRLDPCLGPRILRIAPLLGLRDATPTGAGDGALCYPTAILLGDIVQDGGDMRPLQRMAVDSSCTSKNAKKASIIRNQRLTSGIPFLGDIRLATWNAQSLCCEDRNKFR